MITYKQFHIGFFTAILFFAVMLCNSCDNTESEKVSNDQIILLTVLDQNNSEVTELAGDGETLLKIRVKIPADADKKYSKVTFKTSKGQFLSASPGTVYEGKTNADGIAEVYLKVPLEHGAFFVSGEIGDDSGKYISEKRVNLLDVGQIIDLVVLDQNGNPINTEIRADGNTVLTLNAMVNFNPDAIGFIKFINSGGTFLGINKDDNIVAINNKIATIQYKVSKNVGEAYLKAEASTNSNIFKNKSIKLSRAYADHVFLEPSTLTVDGADDLVKINTYLIRDIGNVSIGTTAQYKAFQVDAKGVEVEVGRFTGLAQALTDDNGQITSVNFVVDTGDIDFQKPIIVRVSTKNDKNELIYQSFILNKK